ncbi:aminoglycoside phosphotransferase family protein [Desulfosediminicola flagellatus]|uniref:aminoglycoside phosphotransferase family protein n=1 Tax=Desulfosediminicola flagellatus TaxID=2569541 RepID=UPI0010AD2681|nr:phosphotransferase [Desulfosediminicola flagellatus]
MNNDFPKDLAALVKTLITRRFPTEASSSKSTDFVTSHEKLQGDGSNRKFWRIRTVSGRDCILVAPEKNETKELCESKSVWEIGNHLYRAGVSVPELYGFDEQAGILICEDLGNTHLHSLVIGTSFESTESTENLRKIYRETLDQLVTMQLHGGLDFQSEWCWDTSLYDKELMLERESGYFLTAFWQGLIGKDIPKGINNEFEKIADIAASAKNTFFLHRDFQSRNVMIKDGKVRIIDFQGGRRGPLGYDLASLLIDPYVSLPLWFQKELYDYYLQKVETILTIDREVFAGQFIALSMQRNLQILGAFAFLSEVRGKLFFRNYVQPSLISMTYLLQQAGENCYPILVDMVAEAEIILEKNNF